MGNLIGNSIPVPEVSDPSQYYMVPGPWRVKFRRPVELTLDSLAKVSSVIDAAKIKCHSGFEYNCNFDIIVDVNLEAVVMEDSADREDRISVTVHVLSVRCYCGPVYDVDGVNKTRIPNYRSFCSRLDIHLDPDVDHGLVNVVLGRSTANPTSEVGTSSGQQKRLDFTMGTAPRATAGITKVSSTSRIESGKQVWTHDLTKDDKYGFFWDCDLGTDQVLESRRNCSTSIQPPVPSFPEMYGWWKRHIVSRRKNGRLQPWMHLIDRNLGSNNVVFSKDVYTSPVVWNFPSKLRRKEITWKMHIDLKIQVVKIPKHISSALCIEKEVPFSETFDFKDKLRRAPP